MELPLHLQATSKVVWLVIIIMMILAIVAVFSIGIQKNFVDIMARIL